MRVQNKISQEIFRVVLNHFDGYEFEGSGTRHLKSDYDILPDDENNI
jgi:hypothetical protein